MSALNELMRASHSSHAASLEAAHTVGETFASRAARSVRRRRAVRATGYGGVSVLAVGAAGVVWWTASGNPAVPPAGSPGLSTCLPSVYVPPNPAAMGDASFALRGYVDLRKDSPTPDVVATLQNGTAYEVLPNADGDYIFAVNGTDYTLVTHDLSAQEREQPSFTDFYASGWATESDWDPKNYLQTYKWTTVVPSHVPDWVNAAGLRSTLGIVTGRGGPGYREKSVPAGAVTDFVVTTAKGEEITRMKEGDSGPDIADRTDVLSVALRVSGLPGGETFSIVSTYDPDGVPNLCSSAPTAMPIPTPAPPTN